MTWGSPRTVFTLYGLSALILCGAFSMRIPPIPSAVGPLERALCRGEIAPGVPLLDPDDPMANAAAMHEALERPSVRGCSRSPRTFSVRLEARTRHVRIPSSVVCQLDALKAISVSQPGFGTRGLAEVAAFLLARPLSRREELGEVGTSDDVELTRIVIPPFHFTRDTITFLDADLGPLEQSERLVGTYHTHPDDDLEEGLLSLTDLRYMEQGHIDFHGAVGWLAKPSHGLDWIFDIVDPREGAWNVFAHDRERLAGVWKRCQFGYTCPLEDLRIAGSPYYLLVRTYEEHLADAL